MSLRKKTFLIAPAQIKSIAGASSGFYTIKGKALRRKELPFCQKAIGDDSALHFKVNQDSKLSEYRLNIPCYKQVNSLEQLQKSWRLTHRK